MMRNSTIITSKKISVSKTLIAPKISEESKE
jgi:hypothetical protein